MVVSIGKNGDDRGNVTFGDDGSVLCDYVGAKGGAGVYQTIINQIPPHETYIEAFVGSGQILRRKKAARCSIVIDRDAAVIAEWSKNRSVIAICSDAGPWLQGYAWKGDEVVYCDPPYLFSVRSSQRELYDCEMGQEDEHRRLLSVLRNLPARVLLSGYPSPLYDELLSDWRVVTYKTVTRSGDSVVEGLWMNYPEPFSLHEYTFLGSNFRERERIKRKKQRWKAKLSKMTMLERAAILDAVQDLTVGNDDVGLHR